MKELFTRRSNSPKSIYTKQEIQTHQKKKKVTEQTGKIDGFKIIFEHINSPFYN